MTNADEVDSYMIQSGVPYDQLGEGTWVLRPESLHDARIGVTIEDPIVLFSMPVVELPPERKNLEPLFQRLLELNGELLHSAYSLQGSKVVLSGAQQLENLDFNEFQAVLDDMCMALDNHFAKIAPMVASHAADRSA